MFNFREIFGVPKTGHRLKRTASLITDLLTKQYQEHAHHCFFDNSALANFA